MRDKKVLAHSLRAAIADASAYSESRGVRLEDVESAPTAGFARIEAVESAANRLIAPENVRRDFLHKEALVNSLYRAVKPDPAAHEFASRCACLGAIAERMRSASDPPDISHVLRGIDELLDQSIAAVPFTIQDARSPDQGRIDLSKIDFEALSKKFEKKAASNMDIERLKAAVRAQLKRMVRLNPTRADYLEKFQALIESYNSGSRNIDEIFRDLVALSKGLTDEQTRHVREHLSEEELTIFDILLRPGPALTAEERDEVKKVAQQLLERLKSLLVLGWRQRVTSRARVQLEIQDALDQGLPRAYSKEIYEEKCTALFEHVYESYMGEGKSVYADAA